MKVIVTGGAGYLGTTIVPFLLENGFEVTVIDRFFFGKDRLSSSDGNLKLIPDDVRWFDGQTLIGYDAVVDMAALSNDPAGELDPWKTFDINYLGRSRVARLAKEAKVPLYLLISSCSIYGFQDGILTEDSEARPLTTYSKANYLAEKDNLSLGDESFHSTVFRLATAYGLSRRMRFDLAVNGMVLGALKTGKIPVMRDGTQWRPFIHVSDIARAILLLLQKKPKETNRQIINVGSDDQNYQIKELAEIVAGSLSKKPEIEWYGSPDRRSYRVSFAKARKTLGYESKTTPGMAAKEIENALLSGKVKDSTDTKTLDWYKHLLSDKQASREVELRGVVL